MARSHAHRLYPILALACIGVGVVGLLKSPPRLAVPAPLVVELHTNAGNRRLLQLDEPIERTGEQHAGGDAGPITVIGLR